MGYENKQRGAEKTCATPESIFKRSGSGGKNYGLPPTEAEIFENNSKAAALYDVFSNFMVKRAFNPQEVKEHVLDVCKEISKNPSEIDACIAQIVQHRETVCKASPLIARDTCADILQNAFPSDETSSVTQNTQPEKSPSFRDKLKFWKKFKNSDTKASA